MTEPTDKPPPDNPDASGAPGWEDDPDAPPSADEIAESERLRQELDDPSSKHPDVALMRALRHAVEPRPIEAATHARILERVVPKPKRSTSFYYLLGGLAAAAGVVLYLQSASRLNAPQAMALELVKPHQSTEPLPKEGVGSIRVDTIVASRARDLRKNRYAKWGVK
jgi:hypothetical protein